jgi:outer membrane immunogenic protein
MGNDTRTFVGAGLVTPGGVTLVGEKFSQDVDMVTVRLNYRFGGYGAPARY